MSDLLKKLNNSETMRIIHEYYSLASDSEFRNCEEKQNRMNEILDWAIHDSVLNLLISEVDRIIYYEIEITDLSHCQNQQALLRERLGTNDISQNIPQIKCFESEDENQIIIE